MSFRILLLFFMVVIISCQEDTVDREVEQKPSISISNSSVFESTSNTNLIFEITIDKVNSESLDISYRVSGISAIPDVDFTADTFGSITIPSGELKVELVIPIINDDIKEVDEKMRVKLDENAKYTFSNSTGIGTIKDDDEAVYNSEDGYITAPEHYGYNITWADEFEDGELDQSEYNYEYGASGWGNNELQNYTDDQQNIFINDSKLTITALKDENGKFTSGRITTQNKKEFRFGRIDVRAKLPKGQGIWPAIWMLGAKFSTVGWPACGEIDIMELVGHQPNTTHGTAHWGLQGESSTHQSKAFRISENFSENFHVFSIVWELNEIVWYVDETQFHRITPSNTNGKPYPFNDDFFFIFNVAVGGNWPGNPDETTDFPQSMEIDYVRVFQLSE